MERIVISHKSRRQRIIHNAINQQHYVIPRPPIVVEGMLDRGIQKTLDCLVNPPVKPEEDNDKLFKTSVIVYKKGGDGLLSNEHGFSLLEMMIASVVLLISMLALLGLTITSMQVNMQNDIRNTAIRLTTQAAEALLILPIENIATCGLTPDPDPEDPNYNANFTYDINNACLGTTGANGFRVYPDPVQSIRGVNRLFNITWNVTSLTNDLRQIDISVRYRYRGMAYTNNTVIYKHRAI